MNLTPENLYDQWVKMMNDSMKVPQSPEQVRREWYKTLKTDELWEVHDEVIRELRSRSIT
jgi:hypothetical protein